MSEVLLDVSTEDPVVVPVGTTQPPLLGTIIAPDGSTQNLAGATVVFYMRPLLSRNPVVSASSAVVLWPPDANGHNVQYNWQSSDTALAGQFMGWWGYDLPGQTLAETPEFQIIITDQGPGFGAQTGVVVDGVAQWMPTTLRALRSAEGFGDRFLQKHADYIKRVVLGGVVSPDAEAAYDPMLVEYLSKRTALRLIIPARDYWARQHRSVQTQGPSENASYPDMLASLDALALRLKQELADDWRQLQYMVPGLPQLRVEPMPASTDTGLCYVTPDPRRTQRERLGGPRTGFFFP